MPGSGRKYSFGRGFPDARRAPRTETEKEEKQTVSADIVPFSKYKGQPVESLLADQDYMRWVVAQVGLMRMLQDRFPAMFNIITIGAPATDDTIQRMIRSP